ncbi:class I SAM-dependent methyltransferase [Flammeovirga pacifica]|uniref:Uncharacterized protein n=1 Tax=Flammeovirga pacifica TaxID=915059 RepID=A0A1S1Z0W0_FLAPC|nr:class I SAM-dependent methyltransferase [Flammeovirga pacifica]OHX66900.1 hypothetical protein NH26_11320 [Flammeovirga pacifica]
MLLKRLEYNTIPEITLNHTQLEMKIQVEEKVNNQIYDFEKVKCAICNSDEYESIGEKDRYGLKFYTNLCKSCGLVYTSPRMTQKSYSEFYNIEYRKLYVGEAKASKIFFDNQKLQGQRIYNFIQKSIIKIDHTSSILEVGCGAGGILKVFDERGHKVKGCDLGEEYLSYGKDNHNLDLEFGFLNDIKVQDKFNLIIYSHVMEHVLDLDSEIENIKKKLVSNGYVYIEVPGIKEIHRNYEGNILKYFQNAHTYHFTLTSIQNLMLKHGFTLVNGNNYVQSLFQWTNKNNQNVNNEYSSIKNYLLTTESLRKFNAFYPYHIKMKIKSFLKKLGLF